MCGWKPGAKVFQLLETLHGFVLAACEAQAGQEKTLRAFLFIRKDLDKWTLNPSRGGTLNRMERDTSRRALTCQTPPTPKRHKMDN